MESELRSASLAAERLGTLLRLMLRALVRELVYRDRELAFYNSRPFGWFFQEVAEAMEGDAEQLLGTPVDLGRLQGLAESVRDSDDLPSMHALWGIRIPVVVNRRGRGFIDDLRAMVASSCCRVSVGICLNACMIYTPSSHQPQGILHLTLSISSFPHSPPLPLLKRPLILAPLDDPPQTRHPLLHILIHNSQHPRRRTIIIQRPLANITQPDMRHDLLQINLRHALGRLEVLPVGLALDEIGVDDARAVDGYLEPFC
jgi:hypothetical protein